MRGLAIIAVAVGCGSSQPAATPAGPPAAMVATRASADDVIVATVNGQPVWGSCVAIQAKRGANKQDALHQCVDFELLAQTADQRGYARDAEVARATHGAMVSELVTTYEDGYQDPAQFGAFWQKAYKKDLWHLRHENYRASSYVRIEVPATAAPEDAAAKKLIADRIEAALANETGLMGPSLLALAQTAAPGVTLKHEDVTAFRAGGLEANYAKALFALPEIGRASPVVRTKWGWDIVVWTDDVPAADPPESEVIAKLLPEVKIAFFPHWVEAIGKSLGVRVTYDEANIAKLEAL
ncbi:MAG: hypothetical protein ABI591_11635 [Kofleriaceae bacterium]